MPQYPPGVLGQVLLVIVLGVEEVGSLADLGGDAVVPGGGQDLLVGLARFLGGPALLVVEGVDGAPVLGPGVVALAHALRRIVALPEGPEQLLVARHLRVEHHQHHLGVPGPSRADLPVRGVRGEAAGVADCGHRDPRELPEEALGAPEAAHAEDGLLLARPRPHQRRAVDEVLLGHGHTRAPARKGLGGAGDAQPGVFRFEVAHDVHLLRRAPGACQTPFLRGEQR